jgi:hypothetical protein
MRKRFRHGIKATAFHEAGHAVVALRLGIRVREARIVKRQDAYIRVSGLRRVSRLSRCVMYAAGEAAEEVFCGKRPRTMSESDLLEIRRERFWRGRAGGYDIWLLVCSASHLLKRNRRAVRRVARALERKRYLSEAELLALV